MPDDQKQPILAAEFKPLTGAGSKRSLPISSGMLSLIVLAGVGIIIMMYLFVARAVVFQTVPPETQISVSGLSFNIGDNYLLLSGDYDITATADGYYPLIESITVDDAASQDVGVQLLPLPGNLAVISDLEDIQVTIDDQPAGTVPGTIKAISPGVRKMVFSKYRYFPLQQEIAIEGRDRTQSVDISLRPAWGAMQLTSEPTAAQVYIDDRLVGQTPLSTEVLETGSRLKLVLAGYKTYQQEILVKAGTSVTHPPIKLIVADGLLQLSSTPSGASITVNNEFVGSTPMTLAMAPFKQHRLAFFLEGYLKTTTAATLKPEKTAVLAVDLVPNIGSIALTISPKGARVLVDNHYQGDGDRTLSLTAKPHRLSIEKSGYQTKSLSVTPRPGHEQALSIKLLTLQEAYWASRPPAIQSSVGSPLVLFRPRQSFTMGAPRRQPGRRANEVERRVSLDRPFYLGTREISNAEYRSWKSSHSSSALQGQTLDRDRQPVAGLTWEDAALYCNWLSRREGLPLFYRMENGVVNGFNWDAHGYRLPTEAEWAWAARVDIDGSSQTLPWVNGLYPPTDVVDNYADRSASRLIPFTIASYNDLTPASAVVGSFKPNGKGLYNMSGNVSEWVNDFYDVRPNRGEPSADPTGPITGVAHVIRGASWALGSRTELRLSYRQAGTDKRLDVGFRIARYVDSVGVKP
ncbi:MAG: sulfatase activating formylglycine-generating enzyme [Parasphingorhabdus sp.]|jgi:formylglycine-generating enzyme required for sulfatase activity|tara:strand:- start:130 stop:2199 length:2070 start_codon:yes stop_codon:yes gene_type:complete